ncbi:HAD-IA family hydrolase [Parvularcula dongshanensis]|uniref:HAD superfamily hydrolase (TIGR01509 family) n=1 Tax=Parvularcula dongshanensis TaxID=1173995 RepID=A0A840I6P7_9PROT|nr:HAD superfamily hydrolase (TIGR01509 family) [Parvularcula dongshanensis]
MARGDLADPETLARLRTARAVIFDCDGVLVDSERLFVDTELEHLAAAGLAIEREDYLARFVGLADVDLFPAMDEAVRAATGQALGRAAFDTMTARKVARLERELEAVEDAVETAKALGLPIAVASNSGRTTLRKKLEWTGLAPLFGEYVFSVDDVENAKPAPDLYLHAARALGVPPHDCVVIEDSAQGVRAAVAAGAMAVGFTGGGHADRGLCDRLTAAGALACASRHKDLPNLLRGDAS